MKKFFLPLIVITFMLINSSIFAQSDFNISIRQLDNPHNVSADYVEGLIVVEYTPGNQGTYLSLGAISRDLTGPFDIIVENLYLPSESEVDTNRYTVSTMYNLANIGVEPLTKEGRNTQQSFTEFVVYIHLLNSIGFYPFADSTFYGQVTISLTVLQIYAINLEFLVSQLTYAPVEPVEQPEEDERTTFINRTKYSNLDLDNSRRPGVDGGYAGDLNACVPAATANSMRWLERNNKIEFTGDASKYANKPYEVLESLSGHMKREKENGTTRENMVRGKLDFIEETKIPLSVKFQSHYIDSAQITSSNKNSVAQNFRREGDEWPDWEFLKQMMKDGEDIEMNYHWEAEDGKWYGHSVFVNGLEEFESGKKKISFSHDRIQGRKNKDNGEDDIGTYRETHEVSIDTNGAMRFGPDQKYRVHTVAAESPYPPEGSATAAFLNEFFAIDGSGFTNKNNSISVDNEFLEIGLGLGVGELNLYEIHIYNADGNFISKYNLSDFEVSASEADYQFYLLNFPSDQLPADKGGIAISYSGTLIPGQYFSYGGEILAQDGIAMNLISENFGDLVAGQSIGLQGVGENYTEFSYDYSSNPTPGEVNDGQILGEIPPLDPPQIINPVESSFQSLSFAFIWNSVQGATNYGLQISLNESFTENIIDESSISDTSFEVTSLDHNSTYFWRLNASSELTTSEWTTGSFTTVLAVPNLSSPVNNSNNNSLQPTLTWSNIDGANSHSVEVNSNSEFDGTIIFDDIVNSNSVQISGLEDNSEYYWRVSAQNNLGNYSSLSEIFNFSTVRTELDPTLNGVIGVTINPSLSWYSTSGAANYRLEVNTTEDFNGEVIVNESTADTSYSLSNLSFNTSYYWRVSADSKSSTLMTSEVYSFTTKLDTPSLISPSNNLLNTSLTPTLSWSSIEGTDYYQFQISTDSIFADNIIIDDTTSENSILISNLSDNIIYYWRVVGFNDLGNQSDASEVFNFSTQQTQLTPTLNNSVGIPLDIDLIWFSTEGANSYHIEVNLNENFDDDVVVDESVLDTLFSLSDLAYNTKYYWRVSAFSKSENTIMTSVTQQFTTKLSTPLLIAPENNSTAIEFNPILNWESVVGAESYLLEVNIDSTFNGAFIFNDYVEDNSNQLSELAENTNYYWRVTAENNQSNFSDVSAVFKFTTIDPTSVEDKLIPKEYELSQNFPNPFNPSTIIKFGLPENQQVKLIVYDLLGREVSTLIDKSLTAGYHSYELIADNLSSGVYIYRIIAGDFVDSKKFIILK